MLNRRVATALLLAPVLILALFYLPDSYFYLLLALVTALGAWEWSGLSPGLPAIGRWAFVGSVLLIGALLYGRWAWAQLISVLASVWWGLWFTRLWFGVPDRATSLLAHALDGILILVPAWFVLAALRIEGVYSLLSLLLLVWIADIGAYYSGRTWGRRPLAAKISPNKTIEGLVGGLGAALLFAMVSGILLWRFPVIQLLVWAGLCFLSVLFSVLGDLVESRAKRVAKVKDSGLLLPGHGGILDRIDSLTAAAPIFLLGWLLFFSGPSH